MAEHNAPNGLSLDRLRKARQPGRTEKTPEQALAEEIANKKRFIASALGAELVQQKEYDRFAKLPPSEQEAELARMNRVFASDEAKLSPAAYLETLKPYLVYSVRVDTGKADLMKLLLEEGRAQGLSEEAARARAAKEIEAIVPRKPKESKPTPSPERVTAYKKIASLVQADGGKNQIVYYPASGTDVSPSSAFPEALVYYADIDGRAMRTLAKNGYDAFLASATKDPVKVGDEEIPPLILPEPPTMLILVNPSIPVEHSLSLLVPGGIAIVNDYHATARELQARNDMEFVGMMRPGSSKEGFDSTSIPDNPGVGSEDVDSFFVFRKRGAK